MAKLVAAHRDYEFAARLDQVRLNKAIGLIDNAVKESGAWDPNRAEDYLSVFSAYNFRFHEPAYDRAGYARRIEESPVKDYILAAIDDCAWTLRDRDIGPRMWAVSALVHRQEWRASLMVAPALFDPVVDELLVKHRDELSPALLSGIGVSWANRAPKRAAAIAVLEDAIRRFPSDFWLHLYLGDAYFSNGQTELALGSYRSALAIRPGVKAVEDKLAKLWSTRRPAKP